MSEPVTDKPAEAPKEVVLNAPQIVNGVEVYNSSEEFARAHARQAEEEAAKKAKPNVTEADRLRGALNAYIAKYSSTTEVRKIGTENGKSAEHNLDVAADIVTVLNKIKNELRMK